MWRNPSPFMTLLRNVKKREGDFCQIFVAFSENLNFYKASKWHIFGIHTENFAPTTKVIKFVHTYHLENKIFLTGDFSSKMLRIIITWLKPATIMTMAWTMDQKLIRSKFRSAIERSLNSWARICSCRCLDFVILSLINFKLAPISSTSSP